MVKISFDKKKVTKEDVIKNFKEQVELIEDEYNYYCNTIWEIINNATININNETFLIKDNLTSEVRELFLFVAGAGEISQEMFALYHFLFEFGYEMENIYNENFIENVKGSYQSHCNILAESISKNIDIETMKHYLFKLVNTKQDTYNKNIDYLATKMMYKVFEYYQGYDPLSMTNQEKEECKNLYFNNVLDGYKIINNATKAIELLDNDFKFSTDQFISGCSLILSFTPFINIIPDLRITDSDSTKRMRNLIDTMLANLPENSFNNNAVALGIDMFINNELFENDAIPGFLFHSVNKASNNINMENMFNNYLRDTNKKLETVNIQEKSNEDIINMIIEDLKEIDIKMITNYGSGLPLEKFANEIALCVLANFMKMPTHKITKTLTGYIPADFEDDHIFYIPEMMDVIVDIVDSMREEGKHFIAPFYK